MRSVDRKQLRGEPIAAEMRRGVYTRPLPEPGALARAEHGCHSIGEGRGVARGNPPCVLSLLKELCCTAGARHNNGPSAGHGFDDSSSKWFRFDACVHHDIQ